MIVLATRLAQKRKKVEKRVATMSSQGGKKSATGFLTQCGHVRVNGRKSDLSKMKLTSSQINRMKNVSKDYGKKKGFTCRVLAEAHPAIFYFTLEMKGLGSNSFLARTNKNKK